MQTSKFAILCDLLKGKILQTLERSLALLQVKKTIFLLLQNEFLNE